MTEQKVKNRGWVKNAAIIFLAVMLVLTFFSSTIMNASLPEVATQSASSGSITTRVRGTGTVEATETYEVKCSDSRRVKSVLVKVGYNVEPGDVLFVLAEGDSDEAEQLKSQLDDLMYQYQVKLINLGSSAEGESRALQRAREKLEAAITERDSLVITAEEVNSAKIAYDEAAAEYKTAADKLAAAGGDTSGSSPSYSPVQSAENALNDAKTALSAAQIRYGNEYRLINELAADAYRAEKGLEPAVEVGEKLYKPYAEAISSVFSSRGSVTISDYFTDDATLTERTNLRLDGVDIESEKYTSLLSGLTDTSLSAVAGGYSAVTDAQDSVDYAQENYDSAVDSYYNMLGPNNSKLKKEADEAEAKMNSRKEIYDQKSSQLSAYENAKDSVVSLQDSLEDLIISEQLSDLELSRMSSEIADVRAKLNEVSGGGTGGEIVSEVSGVVKTVGITAGNTTDPTTALCTIEVPDRGYSVSISVTNEQAQKVSIGDSAEITTGYWGGSDIQGRLSAIRTDPKNPQSNKLLIFTVTGSDVESGRQVSVSIGQRSQNYDVVVPNSAIREDSNGKFVLLVVAKSSPLGNRYVATRADVNVLASDDTNSAVSGGVSAWDWVITTSDKPIEDGMLVRMPDN